MTPEEASAHLAQIREVVARSKAARAQSGDIYLVWGLVAVGAVGVALPLVPQHLLFDAAILLTYVAPPLVGSSARMPDPTRLDPLIHAPVRLAIVGALAAVESMAFTALREATSSTDGNLSAHLGKLEEAGYVAVEKSFVGRNPLTTIRLTDLGRDAFLAYLDALAEFLPRS